MAVEIIGSPLTFDLTGNDPPAQLVDVPVDAQGYVVGYHLYGWHGLRLETLTLAGVSASLLERIPVSDNGDDGCGIAFGLVGGNTGSQALDWSWTEELEIHGGPSFGVVWLRGIDVGDPVRDSAAGVFPEGGAQSLTLTTEPGDLVIGIVGTVDGEDDEGNPILNDPNPNADQTVIEDNHLFDSQAYWQRFSIACKFASGTSTQFFGTGEPEAPWPTLVLAAVAIKPAAGTPITVTRGFVLEALQGVRGSRAARIESIGTFSATKSARLESLAPASIQRSAPLEVVRGVVPARTAPVEALGAPRASRLARIESIAARTFSRASRLEILSGVRPARVLPVEASQGGAFGRDLALESLGAAVIERHAPTEALGSVRAERPLRIEALMTLAVQRALPIESHAEGHVIALREMPLEVLQWLALPRVTAVEALATVEVARSAALEAVQAVAPVRSLALESGTEVVASRALALEILASVVAARAAALEVLVDVQAARALYAESRAELVFLRSLPIESIVIAQLSVAREMPFEILAGVPRTFTALLEGLGGVVGPAAAVNLEALAGLALSRPAPVEALLGIVRAAPVPIESAALLTLPRALSFESLRPVPSVLRSLPLESLLPSGVAVVAVPLESLQGTQALLVVPIETDPRSGSRGPFELELFPVSRPRLRFL